MNLDVEDELDTINEVLFINLIIPQDIKRRIQLSSPIIKHLIFSWLDCFKADHDFRTKTKLWLIFSLLCKIMKNLSKCLLSA